jgi:STE24 endopeptidase
MHPATITWIYIALAALDLAWGLFLTALNYRNVAAHRAEVPPALAGAVTPAEAEASSAYSLAKMRFSFVEGPVTALATVLAAALGLFGLLDGAICDLVRGQFWRGALFMASVAVLSALLSAPFSVYGTFVLEKRFGFNTTTFRTWLLDALKGAVLSTAIGLPLLALLFWFMDATGSLWWLWAAAIFAVVDLAISLLYPLVIAPLFNKFVPLAEGSLAERIRAMAGRLGFRMGGIFVMDGSKRSRHSNAYFTGLGAAKRVVLYDTLVSSMSEDEVLAVLGHEIGHEKKRHVIKMTLVSIVLSFAGFWVLSLLAGWSPLYAAFGFPAETKEAILLIFGLVAGPATFFLAPLFSAWSRKHEYEADAFAVRALASSASAADAFAVRAFEGGAGAVNKTGRPAAEATGVTGITGVTGVTGAAALSSALIRLNRENASNLWPHPLYSFWYYSHPTLTERLAALSRLA